MISMQGGFHRQLLNEDENLDAAFNGEIADESLIHHIAHETGCPSG
jgi:hypothetical protein